MDEDVRLAIDGLRDLIMEKFASLEKQLELREVTVNERRAAQAAKDKEQDMRLNNVEYRVACLEKAPAEGTRKRWESILDKALAWIVPVLLAALLYWASKGFPLK